MDTRTIIIICNSLAFCLSLGFIFTAFNKGKLIHNILVFTLLAFIEMSLGDYMSYFAIFLPIGIIIFHFLKSLRYGYDVDFHSIFLGVVPVSLVLQITSVYVHIIVLLFNLDPSGVPYHISIGGLVLITCMMVYYVVSHIWKIEFKFSKSIEIFLTLIAIFGIVYQNMQLSESARKNALLHLMFVGVVVFFLIASYFLIISANKECKLENINHRFLVERVLIESQLKQYGFLHNKKNEIYSLDDINDVILMCVESAKELNTYIGNDNVTFNIAILPTMPKRVLLDVYTFFQIGLSFCFCDIHAVSSCKAFSMSVSKGEDDDTFSLLLEYTGDKEFSKSDFKNWINLNDEKDTLFLSNKEIILAMSSYPVFATTTMRKYKQKLVMERPQENIRK